MITFRPAQDLTNAAELTFTNMRSYYEKYAVEWDKAQIEKITESLTNRDIMFSNQPVGVIRLSFDDDGCYLRDLQVDPHYQNKGIGSHALIEAIRLAAEASSRTLRLRVFKISPAVQLYKRHGFMINNEDDRFYYMSVTIS